MARRQAPKRPLSCYNCGEEKRLRVSGATQERKLTNRDGSKAVRRVANVECKNCGQEWLSRHPDALALADKHDLNRKRRHSRQPASV